MSWTQKGVIASWFVGLAIILMFSMSFYHRMQLANASYQQLLVENQQRLQAQEVQIFDAKQQRGMNPPSPPLSTPKEPKEEK